MSVSRIITADTYDDDGFPIEMGLMDTKLGVIDPGLRCKTCRRKGRRMPRAFRAHRACGAGYTCGFCQTDTQDLRATCRNCGALLLDPTQKKETVGKIRTLKKMGQSIEDVVNEVFKEAEKRVVPVL